ncbi:MAG: hypothetical protein R3D90_05135 [Paracoccaceae bacterium]
MRALFAALLLPLLAAPPARAADFTVPVDGRFTESSIQFTEGLGHVYYFAWAVFTDQGRFAICGSGALENRQLRTTVAKMARAGEVRVAGKKYKVDLSYFTAVPDRSRLTGSTANCNLIGPTPAQGSEYELRFGRGAFRG